MIEITDEMIDAYMDGVDGGAWRALDAGGGIQGIRGLMRNGLTAVAPLMVAAEREACAGLADEQRKALWFLPPLREVAEDIACRIRARGDRP